ncbi:hypothetical protein BD324DRAFT_617672 [Kockovaella imperatae]|uniref:Uncharacterized protein n=1 Tax=Kockovaella imperatae TaxID=4999 RepID=A0A1Y1ULF4_9TREE|nr:hypothetical protein BD324DRAFT_617672 [Kockovaella imperatae]ORX38880.1 hypothetical protein BD324DRAFT_617672 [Kockovaella imperatae]
MLRASCLPTSASCFCFLLLLLLPLLFLVPPGFCFSFCSVFFCLPAPLLSYFCFCFLLLLPLLLPG